MNFNAITPHFQASMPATRAFWCLDDEVDMRPLEDFIGWSTRPFLEGTPIDSFRSAPSEAKVIQLLLEARRTDRDAYASPGRDLFLATRQVKERLLSAMSPGPQ